MIYKSEEGLNIMRKLLKANNLSIFAGSGISTDSGLPNWDGFVDKYIEVCEKLNNILDPQFQFTNIIEDARTYKTKDRIGTITALKNKIKECQDNGINVDYCNEELCCLFYSVEENDYHHLIVGTNYQQIITTNYDILLEKAADKDGFKKLLTMSFSYTEQQKISSAIYLGKTSIIHAHGKIVDIKLNQFVLTQDDYQLIMKNNPGFKLIMNTIFLTNSILFVGYGGSDPHFDDIIKDLNTALNWRKSSIDLPKCYFMLREDKITPIRELLNDNDRVDIISFENFEQMKSFLSTLKVEYPRIK